MTISRIFLNTQPALPSIILKAILTVGNKTNEGTYIQCVATPWFEIMRIIENDCKAIYEIDCWKWEEIIAGAYTQAGFDEVILTPRSGDKGRDIIAVRNDGVSIKIVDQVKAYSPDHLVTANDVRALVGVMSMEQDVSKGIITTTSDFAPRVKSDALIKNLLPHRLQLRPKDDLLPWLKKISE